MASDLIRKSRTLELLKYYERQYDGIGRAIRAFEQMETVDAVEVVHGEWIYKGTSDGKMTFECSNCKSLIAGRGRFCKECGAKMDEG